MIAVRKGCIIPSVPIGVWIVAYNPRAAETHGGVEMIVNEVDVAALVLTVLDELSIRPGGQILPEVLQQE